MPPTSHQAQMTYTLDSVATPKYVAELETTSSVSPFFLSWLFVRVRISFSVFERKII